MSGSVKLHHSSTVFGPDVCVNTVNSEMDTSGARLVPIVDLTHDGDDTISHISSVDNKGLVMFTRILCCIREPRG